MLIVDWFYSLPATWAETNHLEICKLDYFQSLCDLERAIIYALK